MVIHIHVSITKVRRLISTEVDEVKYANREVYEVISVYPDVDEAISIYQQVDEINTVYQLTLVYSHIDEGILCLRRDSRSYICMSTDGLLLLLFKKFAIQGSERAISTLSVRRPQPHNTNITVGDKKEASS